MFLKAGPLQWPCEGEKEGRRTWWQEAPSGASARWRVSTTEPQGAGFDGRGDSGKWVTLRDLCLIGILGRSEGEYRGQRLDWGVRCIEV